MDLKWAHIGYYFNSAAKYEHYGYLKYCFKNYPDLFILHKFLLLGLTLSQ